MILLLICTLAGVIGGGCLGWTAAEVKAAAADARIESLEGELAATQATVQVARTAYLARLKRCEGCEGCSAEPQGFADMPDYELGDAS